MFEAAKVSEFANERIDDGIPLTGLQGGLHVFLEPLNAFDGRVDGLEVLFEGDFVSLIRKGEFTEVAHVCWSPLGYARVMESVAKEEGIESFFALLPKSSIVLFRTSWSAMKLVLPVSSSLGAFQNHAQTQ